MLNLQRTTHTVTNWFMYFCFAVVLHYLLPGYFLSLTKSVLNQYLSDDKVERSRKHFKSAKGLTISIFGYHTYEFRN